MKLSASVALDRVRALGDGAMAARRVILLLDGLDEGGARRDEIELQMLSAELRLARSDGERSRRLNQLAQSDRRQAANRGAPR